MAASTITARAQGVRSISSCWRRANSRQERIAEAPLELGTRTRSRRRPGRDDRLRRRRGSTRTGSIPRPRSRRRWGRSTSAVRAGKARYVGISSYSLRRTEEAVRLLAEMGTPLLIHQPSYSMLNRWIETDGLLDVLDRAGVAASCSRRWPRGR
ncbi:MAG TPA: aldo/keto reductase [Solirubrobacteraceae bacterium]|nr:aldo/keto reductase [Solirubrobacteraceae bacterium]